MDRVPTMFAVSLVNMLLPKRLQALTELGIDEFWPIIDTSFPLDLSRNRLVKKALELKATHLLFLDVDMTYPPDMVGKLLKRDRDVVGPLYFKKNPPHQPVPSNFNVKNDPQLLRPIRIGVYEGRGKNRKFKDLKKALVKCDVIGMGGALIKTEVFERIPEPWFEYERYLPTGEMMITEDVPFCRKVKAAGLDIYCDTTIIAPHLKTAAVDQKPWAAYLQKKDRGA